MAKERTIATAPVGSGGFHRLTAYAKKMIVAQMKSVIKAERVVMKCE